MCTFPEIHLSCYTCWPLSWSAGNQCSFSHAVARKGEVAASRNHYLGHGKRAFKPTELPQVACVHSQRSTYSSTPADRQCRSSYTIASRCEVETTTWFLENERSNRLSYPDRLVYQSTQTDWATWAGLCIRFKLYINPALRTKNLQMSRWNTIRCFSRKQSNSKPIAGTFSLELLQSPTWLVM